MAPKARLSWNHMKLPWCAALAAASLSAQTFAGAQALDEAINQAIAQDRLPGAVLLVGTTAKFVYRKAYGKACAGSAAGGHDPRYHLRLRLPH